MDKAIIKKKILVSETLLSIPVGNTVEIARKDIKDRSVIYAATRLKKRGYLFKTSVAGRVDSIAVTRLK